jgi:hypothetical protein
MSIRELEIDNLTKTHAVSRKTGYTAPSDVIGTKRAIHDYLVFSDPHTHTRSISREPQHGYHGDNSHDMTQQPTPRGESQEQP